MDLKVKGPNGRYRKATRSEVLEAAAAYAAQAAIGVNVRSPDQASLHCVDLVGRFESERFGVLFLDNRHRIIAAEIMFRGTIDGTSVYPREVVKRALELNAAALILTHNHPSGIAEPSAADERITLRLRDALQLVDIRVLDHVIVGDGTTTSLAARGLI